MADGADLAERQRLSEELEAERQRVRELTQLVNQQQKRVSIAP